MQIQPAEVIGCACPVHTLPPGPGGDGIDLPEAGRERLLNQPVVRHLYRHTVLQNRRVRRLAVQGYGQIFRRKPVDAAAVQSRQKQIPVLRAVGNPAEGTDRRFILGQRGQAVLGGNGRGLWGFGRGAFRGLGSRAGPAGRQQTEQKGQSNARVQFFHKKPPPLPV